MMVSSEQIAKVILIQRTTLMNKIKETEEGKALAQSENDLLGLVKQTAENGSVEDIIKLEKAILEHVFDEHVNSKAMERSFATAILELGIIEEHLTKVDNYDKYREIDDAFQNPKNRQKGLPIDEARQAFKGHIARLTNQDKSDLGDNEKKLINARRHAFTTAHRRYQNRQAKTLNIKL